MPFKELNTILKKNPYIRYQIKTSYLEIMNRVCITRMINSLIYFQEIIDKIVEDIEIEK